MARSGFNDAAMTVIETTQFIRIVSLLLEGMVQ